MGMAYGRSFEHLEVAHTADIIRDVFWWLPSNGFVVYDDDTSLAEELRSPKHSIETWGLCTNRDEVITKDYVHHWEIEYANAFFGSHFANLFIWMNYEPKLTNPSIKGMCHSIKRLMALDSFVVIVNPPYDLPELKELFIERNDLAEEMKRYSLFANENVQVFQNESF